MNMSLRLIYLAICQVVHINDCGYNGGLIMCCIHNAVNIHVHIGVMNREMEIADKKTCLKSIFKHLIKAMKQPSDNLIILKRVIK